jgi:flagellar hook-basal body complex protein FliE
MSTTILPIRSPSQPAIGPLPSIRPADDGGRAVPSSFSDLISSSIGTVEQATRNADHAAQRFLSGENEDLHTVAIAEQRAEITSDLFLQVRNKAISAYQEIMKMQL